MRLEFKRRINLIQMHYRNKKFGEPLALEAQDIIDDDGIDVWKELGGKETLARLRRIEE